MTGSIDTTGASRPDAVTEVEPGAGASSPVSPPAGESPQPAFVSTRPRSTNLSGDVLQARLAARLAPGTGAPKTSAETGAPASAAVRAKTEELTKLLASGGIQDAGVFAKQLVANGPDDAARLAALDVMLASCRTISPLSEQKALDALNLLIRRPPVVSPAQGETEGTRRTQQGALLAKLVELPGFDKVPPFAQTRFIRSVMQHLPGKPEKVAARYEAMVSFLKSEELQGHLKRMEIFWTKRPPGFEGTNHWYIDDADARSNSQKSVIQQVERDIDGIVRASNGYTAAKEAATHYKARSLDTRSEAMQEEDARNVAHLLKVSPEFRALPKAKQEKLAKAVTDAGGLASPGASFILSALMKKETGKLPSLEKLKLVQTISDAQNLGAATQTAFEAAFEVFGIGTTALGAFGVALGVLSAAADAYKIGKLREWGGELDAAASKVRATAFIVSRAIDPVTGSLRPLSELQGELSMAKSHSMRQDGRDAFDKEVKRMYAALAKVPPAQRKGLVRSVEFVGRELYGVSDWDDPEAVLRQMSGFTPEMRKKLWANVGKS